MKTNTKVTPRILSGFMELLPAEQIAFEKMQKIIRDTYESFGFVPLDTPVLELSDVLLAKAGGETEQQIYRFKKGDTDLSMRFDLTVPLARYVAQYQNDLSFPFRRYQISKVYRGERPQKGRFREFYQADIDIIGSENLNVLYDAEVPAIVYTTFKNLGLNNFCIRINNRKLLRGFYEFLNLQDQSVDILHLIDKIKKIGPDNVRACLNDLNIPVDKIDQIMDFTLIQGTNTYVLAQFKNWNITNESYTAGLTELESVCAAMRNLGVDESNYVLDPQIIRGLDYYTGTVYETFVPGKESWGSICSGGRYDNLATNYTDRKLPGVGMGMGITRLFDLFMADGIVNVGTSTRADVLILPMDEDTSYALQVSSALRQSGVRAEVFLSNVKFKNKMNYANKTGVPFVAILGETERGENKVALKDMQTGTQELLEVKTAAQKLLTARQTKDNNPFIKA
ncbi:MAG: histidine--tRNA ligase [Lactobacillales bacterium]|jgi:histidyl-tRNA synthetase|nr:histidine--tRNA ligase [Lactobacillales bacterium]